MLRHHTPFERARVNLRVRLKMASMSSVAHQKKDRSKQPVLLFMINLLPIGLATM